MLYTESNSYLLGYSLVTILTELHDVCLCPYIIQACFFRTVCQHLCAIYATKCKCKVEGKCKGEVHPRTGHESPKGKKRYSSVLSLTSALDGGGWLGSHPGRFTLGTENLYQLHRRLDEPQDRSGQVRKSRPHRDSIPEPPST